MTEQEIDQLAQQRATTRWRATHHIPAGSEVLYDDASWRQMYAEEVQQLRDEESRRVEARHAAIRADEERRVAEYDARERARAASPSVAAVTPCPIYGPPPPPPPNPNCTFTQLKIHKRDDSDRVFESNRDTGSNAYLEIVGGQLNAAYVEAELEGVRITCTDHNNRVWNTSPRISGADLSVNNRLNFRPPWQGNPELFGIWNRELAPTSYTITATTHGSTKTCLVKVYPDIQVAGNLVLAMSVNAAREIQLDNVNVSISKTWDGSTRTYGDTISRNIRSFGRGLVTIVSGLKGVCDFIARGSVEWTCRPPSVTLSANTQWQEIPAQRRCGYYANVSLAATPLVGIEFSISLSNTALSAIPYIGQILVRQFGDRIRDYFNIRFSLTLDLNGTINYTRQIGGSDGRTTGTLAVVTTLNFQIIGQLRQDFRIFAINCSVTGGARCSVTISVSGPNTDAQGLFVGLLGNFDGANLYAGMSCRAGTSRTEVMSDTSSRGRAGGGEETWQIIGPRQFMDERKRL